MNRIIFIVSFTAFDVLGMIMLIKSYTPLIRETLLKNRLKGIVTLIVFLLIVVGLLFLFFAVLHNAS